MPGRTKTCSTRMVPPSMAMANRPAAVTTGIAALRSAWRSSSDQRGRPAMRSAVMNSRPSTSAMASLVCLAIPVTPTAARVITGRTSERSHAPGSCPSGTNPELGSRCARTAMNSMRIRPSQKFGTAKVIQLAASTTRPSGPRHTAPARPRATPATTVTRVAPMTSHTVAGSRCASSLVTGWLVNSEVPSVPCSTPSIQCQYWTPTGAVRPSLASVAWYSAAVCPAPRILTAGSPGTMATMRKVRIDTANSSGTDSSSRRSR